MGLIESNCLGMYHLLEATTMVSAITSSRPHDEHNTNQKPQLHDMNVFLVSWYTPVLLEANKFWFYAICMAIARTASDLFFGPVTPSTQNGSVNADTERKERPESTSPLNPDPSSVSLLNRLVIDSLDLTIPGSLLGWIPVSEMGVALAMLASTILVWPTAWSKAP
jgi:Peroxisomal biogenesis factor 11 (PEX11).